MIKSSAVVIVRRRVSTVIAGSLMGSCIQVGSPVWAQQKLRRVHLLLLLILFVDNIIYQLSNVFFLWPGLFVGGGNRLCVRAGWPKLEKIG